jgi:hypothetical protein
MKKYLLLTLIIAFLLVLPLNAAIANESKDGWNVEYEAKEVKDKDLLYDRAKKGITDYVEDQANGRQATLKNNDTGEIKNITMISTTQKLKKQKKGNQVIESYATTSFAIVPAGYSGSGSDASSAIDPSIGVRANNTVYWDNYYDSNNTLYKDITSATGSWDILDPTFYVQGQQVRLEAAGATPSGTSQNVDKWWTSGMTFYVTAPPEWQPVVILTSTYRVLGSDMLCTIHDATTSWSFRFDHRI